MVAAVSGQSSWPETALPGVAIVVRRWWAGGSAQVDRPAHVGVPDLAALHVVASDDRRRVHLGGVRAYEEDVVADMFSEHGDNRLRGADRITDGEGHGGDLRAVDSPHQRHDRVVRFRQPGPGGCVD